MNKKWLYIMGLIGVAAIWGFNFGVSRLSMETFDAKLFVFLRFAIAVPILFLILWWKEGHITIRMRDLPLFLVLGLLGTTLLEILVMYSIDNTTLANASLLNVAPWPIFVALLIPFVLKEKIASRVYAGGAVAMCGVVMVIVGGEEGLDLSKSYMMGNLAAILVSILGALMSVMSMRLMTRYSALRVSTWQITIGVMFLFPLTWGTWSQVSWSSLGGLELGIIGYNVVFSTVIAFIVWNVCMYQIGATASNFFRYVVPVAAVISGFIMYDERVGLLQLIGAVCMASGLVWISMERNPSITLKKS
jgi:drug/metabolite transporter (DMT)-like permease